MKRRGFTLIELMVVIAIIIILAAIAIPNYLTMTARAKKSRVASDFAAIATALETYRTDWNQYPVLGGSSGSYTYDSGTAIITPATGVYGELTGSHAPVLNTGTTAAGETAPIAYITENILKSMINPYSNASANEYKYTGSAKHWLLTAPTLGTPATLWRTDETTTLSDASGASIPGD